MSSSSNWNCTARDNWLFKILTVYETTKLEDNLGHFDIWNETIAGRSVQEIGSCLWKRIEGLPANITDVRLCSDLCGGQNKNYTCQLCLCIWQTSNA